MNTLSGQACRGQRCDDLTSSIDALQQIPETLYELLGISRRAANKLVIKAAFRKVATIPVLHVPYPAVDLQSWSTCVHSSAHAAKC